MTARPEAALAFQRLHREARPLLILPNAWDAGSARLVESLGAPAIATTSAAVAWAHGYRDGNQLPLPLLLHTVEAIARVVTVPITVDMEGGFGADPKAVGASVGQVVAAGAVGCNIEDGTQPAALLADKIAAARAAADRAGVALYINARTDVYLHGLVPPEQRLAETLARAARYKAAGASGLFVPGLTDPGEIGKVVAGTDLPVNCMARPGLPVAADLAKLGVRRLSAGASIGMAVWGRLAALTQGFLAEGRSEAAGEGALPYPAINGLFPAS